MVYNEKLEKRKGWTLEYTLSDGNVWDVCHQPSSKNNDQGESRVSNSHQAHAVENYVMVNSINPSHKVKKKENITVIYRVKVTYTAKKDSLTLQVEMCNNKPHMKLLIEATVLL